MLNHWPGHQFVNSLTRTHCKKIVKRRELVCAHRHLLQLKLECMGSFPLILVAEDDTNDVFFLRRAFQKAEIKCQIVDVPNGQEAMRYLEGDQPYQDRQEFPRPSLLLLDLKMPLVNGFELLEWLRLQRKFDDLPALVLSSSAHEGDMVRARELGAREYHVKPSSLAQLTELAQDIASKWLPEQASASKPD